MSSKSELLEVERQLQTLSDSHYFPNISVLIKTVDMFSRISKGKPFSEALNKELISANVREIKAFMQKYEISDIREMVKAARMSESFVKKYKTLLLEKKEGTAKDEMLSEEDNILSGMFSDNETIIEDEIIMSDIEEDYDEQDEKTKAKSKSKPKPKPKKEKSGSGVNSKKIFYGIVTVFSIGIIVFVYLMITSMLEEIEIKEAQKLENKQAKSGSQGKRDSPTHGTENNMPSVQNNVSAKFGTETEEGELPPPPTSSTHITKMTPPPPPPDDYKTENEAVQSEVAVAQQAQQSQPVTLQSPPMVENKQEVVEDTAYPPIPVSSVKRNPGGICQLVPKYFSKEDDFVYYVKRENGYVPAFQDRNWDGKGLKVEKRTVGLSVDEENGLVEIENGKFLPIELFSSCSLFEQ